MVRTGILLYGGQPPKDGKVRKGIRTKPLLTWKTKVTFIKEVFPGQRIGYGFEYTVKKRLNVFLWGGIVFLKPHKHRLVWWSFVAGLVEAGNFTIANNQKLIFPIFGCHNIFKLYLPTSLSACVHTQAEPRSATNSNQFFAGQWLFMGGHYYCWSIEIIWY